MYIENIVIGNPVCEPWLMFAKDEEDFVANELQKTHFTQERNLARLLVECGLTHSVSEVRRNKPEFCTTNFGKVDFITAKWGKRKIYIQVGL